MKFQPLFGRVILKVVPEEMKTTEGGIIMVGTVSPFRKAVVVAIAPDAAVNLFEDGKRKLEVTDIVYFEGDTFPIKDAKDEYGMIRVEQIAYVCLPCSGIKSE